MDFFWVFLAVFLVSLLLVLRERLVRKDRVEAQFVGIGLLALLFYAVCFLSGICTILNFLWKWVF
jgi:hypothetical protein